MERLKDTQRQVVELVSQGMSQREAAKRVGVTEVTVSRWKKEDRNFRLALTEQTMTTAQEAQFVTARTLASVMLRIEAWLEEDFDSLTPDQKIKVASMLLTHAPKMPETAVRRTLNQTVNQTWNTGPATIVGDDGQVVECAGRSCEVEDPFGDEDDAEV